jgi:hypothetical protein
MTALRMDNKDYTDLNKECRKRLAEHLCTLMFYIRETPLTWTSGTRLGIAVDPSQVQLRTEDTDDLYIWSRTKDWDSLFERNLSDLSVRALQKLHDGVEKELFSAVWKEGCKGFQATNNVCMQYLCKSN